MTDQLSLRTTKTIGLNVNSYQPVHYPTLASLLAKRSLNTPEDK